MNDRTQTREAGTEAEAGMTRLYEPKSYDYVVEELRRATTGQIVVRAAERPWDVHKQANSKRYLSPYEPDLQHTALQEWEVFLQVFNERSGKHRHQGGIIIFVLEGRGYTVMDGERCDWEAGDLMLLPMRLGGVEHQHFNEDPNVPAKWIAFVYWPHHRHGGSEVTQIETSPIYDQWMARVAEDRGRFDGPGRGQK